MKNNTEISFYQLTTTPLLNTLPKILEKILASEKRAVVMFASEDKMEEMNKYLWSFSTKTVIPHGSSKDEFKNEQPVYLTAGNDNPNGAQIIVVTANIEPENINEYEKCLFMFDGNVEDELLAARNQWKKFQQQEYNLTYWKQNIKGGWEKV